MYPRAKIEGREFFCRVFVALLTAVVALPEALAQEQRGVLEEVVVTAQKREENLQDVPISLSVLGPRDLETKAIANVADLGNQVPGLHILPFDSSPTTLNVYIRGVGVIDSLVTEDAPVAVYLNGVYIARTIGLGEDQADLERIEVLRGPQGTLFGRNTTGGAINIVTAKPENRFAASQLAGFGNFGAVRSQTMLNLPFTDTLYARANFNYSKRNGWVKNTGVGPDFAEYDNRAGRLDLRWKPNDALTVDYSFDRTSSDNTSDYLQLTEGTPAFAFLPQQPHRVASAALPNPFRGNDELTWGHTLTASLQTGIGEFKSITAYRKVYADDYQDYSFNPFIAVYRNDPTLLRQHQISEEVQLVGSSDSKRFDYVAGLYYFDENGTQTNRDPVDIAGPGVFTFYNATAINTTYAVYGQLTWRPDAASPWDVTLGGRYTKDKRTAGNSSTANGGAPVPFRSISYDNFSPSIIGNYKFSDEALLYAKVVSGYKAGGFAMRQLVQPPFNPEKIISYELGWKTEWLEHRLRWNNALFYMDYKDLQLDIPIVGQFSQTEIKNAGKAEVAGMETELNYAATDSLRMELSYAYLYNKIKKVLNDNATYWHLPAAPKNTVNATLDWDIVKLPFGTLNATADYGWRGDAFTTSRQRVVNGVVESNVNTQRGYSLTDLYVSLSGDDWIGHGTNCRVALWVKNLTDTEYKLDPSGSFGDLHAAQFSNFGTPRTYGVDFRIKY